MLAALICGQRDFDFLPAILDRLMSHSRHHQTRNSSGSFGETRLCFRKQHRKWASYLLDFQVCRRIEGNLEVLS